MKQKLNICMLLAESYDPKMPARPSVMEMSKILTRMGHGVTWVMPSEEGAKGIQERYYEGIRLLTIPCYTGSLLGRKIISKILLVWKEVRLASKVIHEKECNIIQAREDISGGLAAIYLKKRYKLPFVFQYSFPFVDSISEKHKSWSLRLLTAAGRFVLLHIMRQADLVLPVSELMRQGLADKGILENKMMSLPLGVNTSLFSPANNTVNLRARYNLGNSSVMIYVGTLDKLRHLSILLFVLARVQRSCRRVKLLVLGQGDDRADLEKLSRNLGLENDVVFVGQVPYSEVPQFIAETDICLSLVPPTNLYKANSPTKLFEYMSMGRPTVANEGLYEHEVVLSESGSGVLVPFTAKTVAVAVVELLTNPERASDMGWMGREWVLRNRSYETLTQLLEERYIELLKKEKSK